MSLPIVATAILRQDHLVKHRPQLLIIDPQPYPGLRQPSFHIEVIAVQGDTAISIGRPWKQGVGKVQRQLVFAVHAPPGLPERLERDRRIEAIFKQTLMRRGVIEVEKRLVGLFEFRRRLGQGELIIVQPTLHVEMRFHPVEVTLALGADNRVMRDAQATADRLKLVGGKSVAAIEIIRI